MKKLLLLIILFNIQAYSQNNDYTKKAQSIDSTIETLYSVISGDKGEERNWNLFKYQFHKDAALGIHKFYDSLFNPFDAWVDM